MTYNEVNANLPKILWICSQPQLIARLFFISLRCTLYGIGSYLPRRHSQIVHTFTVKSLKWLEIMQCYWILICQWESVWKPRFKWSSMLRDILLLGNSRKKWKNSITKPARWMIHCFYVEIKCRFKCRLFLSIRWVIYIRTTWESEKRIGNNRNSLNHLKRGFFLDVELLIL